MSILVLAEKPSVASSISAVLGAKQRGDGFFHGNDWIISWCYGHLVSLSNPAAYGEQYKRWDRAVLPILPDKWQYTTSDDKKKQLDIIRSLMKRTDVDSVICATDAGREGELIFRLVYEYCKCKKPIQRLWISSMEDSAIREGFANLRPGSEFDNLYRAALCRSQADWTVGINATRLFSSLYGDTLSVGRVQSPTLALIVSRQESVIEFKPESFYIPQINTGMFIASGEKQKNAKTAESIRTATDEQDAVCLSLEKHKKTISPPKLYDLTTLQREANRMFGFTAQQTLDYAQSLYEKKIITYPRSDSRFLTSGMATGIPSLIKASASILPFAVDVGFSIDVGCMVNDSKVSDHHALIPTLEITKTDLSALPAGERNILHMLAVRLICAGAHSHIYEVVTAVLECGGHSFIAKGRTILTDGWKVFDRAFRSSFGDKARYEDDSEDDSVLPELMKGQVLSSVSASVKEGKTAPPRHYTEDTLLSAMETSGLEDMPDNAERRGLGTPATRAATIEKLIKSGFVERRKKNLIATQKGINLITVLPDSIKSPLLTAEWEHKLQAVEQGEITDLEFMDGIAAMTRKLVTDHSIPVNEYMTMFRATSDKAGGVSQNIDGEIGKCPKCGFAVVEKSKTEGRQPDFFCANHDCSFALWKDNKYFAMKKKKITKTIAATLLKEGCVFISDLYSEKTGKTYSAKVVMDATGQYVNFKLEFEGSKSK